MLLRLFALTAYTQNHCPFQSYTPNTLQRKLASIDRVRHGSSISNVRTTTHSPPLPSCLASVCLCSVQELTANFITAHTASRNSKSLRITSWRQLRVVLAASQIRCGHRRTNPILYKSTQVVRPPVGCLHNPITFRWLQSTVLFSHLVGRQFRPLPCLPTPLPLRSHVMATVSRFRSDLTLEPALLGMC